MRSHPDIEALYGTHRDALLRFFARRIGDPRQHWTCGLRPSPKRWQAADASVGAPMSRPAPGSTVLPAASWNGLSEPVRRAVQLRVVDELDYEVVAQRLSISQPAARARVSRGLSALAQTLDTHAIQEVTHR